MTDDLSKPSTKLRHFSASLPMLLLRARETVMVRFRAMLRANGLTEQQWRVLRALDASPEMDATKLAEETYLLGPSISRILRDLEAERLIATRPAPEDQRRKLVRIAPGGEERIRVISPLSEAIYADIAERFGDARLSDLQALLETLRQCMSEPRS